MPASEGSQGGETYVPTDIQIPPEPVPKEHERKKKWSKKWENHLENADYRTSKHTLFFQKIPVYKIASLDFLKKLRTK